MSVRRAALLAGTICLVLFATAPVAHAATYEQVGAFAGSATPVAEEKFTEEVQLGGVGGMAVNYTGAGGVEPGTVYAATFIGFNARVAMFEPVPGGLEFVEGWVVTSEGGPYERCGPLLGEEEGKAKFPCPTQVKGGASEVDIDVDQSTGNVYVLSMANPIPKVVVAYTPDGGEEITRFGEMAPSGETVAASPGKVHSSPYPGGLAVNGDGEVYVYDQTTLISAYHRLMVFRPKTPGDYSEYEYAGEVAAAGLGEGESPTKPVTDAKGNVYVAGIEDTYIEMYEPETPQPYPGKPAKVACSFSFEKGGIAALAVNQLSGEPFFYSTKKELKARWVRQLGPCEEGKFKETGKATVLPERAELSALAFDPTQRFQPSRPPGILYGGAPGPVPAIGAGEPGQSSLGYVFAQAQGAVKTLTVAKTGSGAGTVTSQPAGISCGATCSAEFEEGSTVTLTAKAAEGSTFSGWSGSGCSGNATCEVTMSEAKAVAAEFSEEAGPAFHTLKVTVSGEGSVSADTGAISGCTSAGGASCEGSYEEGAKVTLTAKADSGSEFKGWSGSGCSGTATCEVTMTEAKEVTTTFEEEETEEPGIPLTVAVEGTGTGTVTSDKGAISCNPFCSDEYEAGTKVTLTATPAPGSLFYSWRYCDAGGVNGRQCTVSVDKAKTVKATFTTTHALKVSRTGSAPGKVQSSPGGVLCLFNCAETTAAFREGTEVTLKQTPAKHFHFVEWTGDCSGSGTCQVTMGEDHEVSAEFAEDPKHPLTLTKSGGGAGTVKSSVAGVNCGLTCFSQSATYYQGEVVELTATPGKGSAFDGWSGAGCFGTGTCTVTMDEAKALTAEFG